MSKKLVLSLMAISFAVAGKVGRVSANEVVDLSQSDARKGATTESLPVSPELAGSLPSTLSPEGITMPDLSEETKNALDLLSTWTKKNNLSSLEEDGRITFIFGAGVPTIICAPLRVCDIELEPGEVVENLDLGDSVRWVVKPSFSGEAEKTVHIIIKPKDFGLETNAVVTTNRRTYHFRLVSRSGEYLTRVGFFYPENQQKQWEAQKLLREKREALVTADLATVSVDSLRFNYSLEVEGKGHFKPIRVFDDGTRVFIQMPSSMKSDEAPALVLLGEDGQEQLVNYRLRHGYFIVDKVFDRAALIAGLDKGQEKVLITRDSCKKRGFFGNCIERG